MARSPTGQHAASELDPAVRSAGSYADDPAPGPFAGVLDVVTLNIELGRHIDRARRLFERTVELARASVVLLQEMDAEGTDALAASLRMNYVYYPAKVRAKTGRGFGNAVLSRWPIVGDRKLRLPHPSLRDGSPRSATCATVATPAGTIEICSLHLATPWEQLPGARRAQLQAVLDRLGDANPVVLGGDFNSHRLGRLAAARGFDWTTRAVGGTVGYFFSVDHIFARGLRASHIGRVTDTLGATDHAAVWARLTRR